MTEKDVKHQKTKDDFPHASWHCCHLEFAESDTSDQIFKVFLATVISPAILPTAIPV